MHVFYFRGMSTAGNDQVKFGPMDLGPMHKRVGDALERRGIRFHPLLGLGGGSLVELASRAKTMIQNHEVWKNRDVPVQFVGHSAGGLVARIVFEQMKSEERIRSCLTIATPNRGAGLAEHLLSTIEKYPGSHRLMRLIGSDIHRARPYFEEVTKAGLERIFTTNAWTDPRHASIVAWEDPRGWCAPLKAMYKIKVFKDFTAPSDGLVDRDAQDFGRVVAEVSIDHIRQIGLFDQGKRFTQLSDVTADFLKKSLG